MIWPYIGNVEVMTCGRTERQKDRISTCRFDPSGRKGRVKIQLSAERIRIVGVVAAYVRCVGIEGSKVRKNSGE